jgi:hypothetical protein
MNNELWNFTCVVREFQSVLNFVFHTFQFNITILATDDGKIRVPV